MPTDRPLGRLTRSVIAFPWAVSLLGAQQLVRFAQAPEDALSTATRTLDRMSDAARERTGAGWREQPWRAASALRRAAMRLARVRPPSMDASLVTRIAAAPRVAGMVKAAAGYVVPPLAWVDSLRVSSGDAPVLRREVANKLRVLDAVAAVRSRPDLDDTSRDWLRRQLADASDLPDFDRFWTIEPLGARYGERALERAGGHDPDRVLTDATAAALPEWSLLLLHAGIGIAFADAALATVGPASPAPVVRKALTRFVRLCRRSSRPGYAGAAFESLGFVARAWRQHLVPLLDRELPQVDPGMLGYFWHGVGRAMYFAPMNLLPSSNAPRSAVIDLDTEAPHELAYRNALAGIAWGTTLANVEDPEVMDLVLQYHGALAARADAFASGVASAAVAWSLTTGHEEAVRAFSNYEPCAGAAGAAAWRALVALPCRAALGRASREANAPEELVHYRPGPA